MTRSFGLFLRSLRKEKKKTQRDLAREVGIDHTYLSKVENQAPGFTSPSEPTLRKLASALETDPDEMITAAGKVPSDVRQMLVDDFSLIKEIRERTADGTAGEVDD